MYASALGCAKRMPSQVMYLNALHEYLTTLWLYVCRGEQGQRGLACFHPRILKLGNSS